ncbi:variable surface protein [Plasmodium gonderi]|uniref:Variable surface protein n=1 Tax=Plasmodium gonderi TaxID=77519 RepID=A0A1Y1JQ40_PLAGO|nr:variable surface protein [Plasmodium gonderi]GAW84330.1 variable surface protein [Plasmodium gonderi]
MNESIYDVLHLFPLCQEIIHKNIVNIDHASDIWKHACNSNGDKSKIHYLKDDYLKSKNICTIAMLYLVDIQSIKEDTLTEAGCKYFYYWLSYNFKDIKSIEDITYNYKAFLKIYNEVLKSVNGNHKCNKYNDVIAAEDFHLLKAIHDMHTKFNNINLFEEEYSKNINFYNTVKSYVEQYNYRTKNKVSIISEIREPSEFPLVSNCQYSIGKFTTLGSYIFNAILRNRNEWNNVYNEVNIMKPYEISSSISSDKRYNVLYNCD